MGIITSSHREKQIRIRKNFFEKPLWEQGKLVVGIDEVGRGCLAGPLVTAAAILPIGKLSPLLKDSKILSPAERLKAYTWITKHCYYQTAIIHQRLIDSRNIYQATLLAMKRALVQLLSNTGAIPGAVLVDAMPLKLNDTGFQSLPVYYFPKGEQKSSSIAAASIVAKVTRDAMMEQYATLFPGYELEKHKGYATKEHQAAITQYGHSIIHRQSFLGSFLTTIDSDEENQATIF